MGDPDRFDEAYYERHYFDPDTAVADAESLRVLSDFVCHYVHYLDVEVESVLDLGCGIGLWRDVVQRHFAGCSYTGVEISPYVCERLGWIQGSVATYQQPHQADFVICQGVLQYLDDNTCDQAIHNLATLTGGALYLEALTRLDWEQSVSQTVTDGDVFLREGTWYRERLDPHFVSCGGGLFVPRNGGAILYELERA